MLDHISASQINLYLQCGLKYRFQYIDQLPKPFKPSGLAFGSVIHSSLQWLHKERMRGKDSTLEKLYKTFETDWFSQRVDTEIQYKDGDSEEKLVLMGKEILGLYYHAPAKRPVFAEIPFLVPLVDPLNGDCMEIPLEGFIDLIEEDGVVVEFKTSARSIDPQSLSDHLQITAYSYAYEMLYQKKPKLLKIINFVKTRSPKMVILEATREKKDYQRFFYLTREVLKGIGTGIFFPRPTYLCKDCEYELPCKEWEGK